MTNQGGTWQLPEPSRWRTITVDLVPERLIHQFSQSTLQIGSAVISGVSEIDRLPLLERVEQPSIQRVALPERFQRKMESLRLATRLVIINDLDPLQWLTRFASIRDDRALISMSTTMAWSRHSGCTAGHQSTSARQSSEEGEFAKKTSTSAVEIDGQTADMGGSATGDTKCWTLRVVTSHDKSADSSSADTTDQPLVGKLNSHWQVKSKNFAPIARPAIGQQKRLIFQLQDDRKRGKRPEELIDLFQPPKIRNLSGDSVI